MSTATVRHSLHYRIARTRTSGCIRASSVILQTLQLAAKKKVYRNCPARLASVGNETTHVQLRQSKLQTLQTFVHQQWQVCRSQKLLTVGLSRKFMRTPAKKNVRRNCPARLAPVGNETTHVQLRQSNLCKLFCINNGKFARRRNC